MNFTPNFFMLVGVPGSGKSFQAQKLTELWRNSKIVSSDEIRGEIYGDENCQADPGRVFSIMHERALSYLDQGYDVIYDATNIQRKHRKEIIDKIPAHVSKTCYICWAPISVCIERDAKRERTVGKEVIDKMLSRFEAPFYDEGFNEIWLLGMDQHRPLEYRMEVLDSMRIPHDNPHHTLGVYGHCMKAYEYAKNNGFSDILQIATKYHDCGKPYVKSFTDRKGNPCDTAHYYGHQGVGAWISYGLCENSGDLIAWLISTHMAPFINMKYYNSLPTVYREAIDKLHKADLEAH